jgi:polysaccharide pyruvyl transferase WcaK-like protein
MRVSFVNDAFTSKNWGARIATSALKDLILKSGGEIDVNVFESELSKFRLGRPETKSSENGKEKGKNSGIHAGLFIPPVIPKAYRKIQHTFMRKNSGNDIPAEWSSFQKLADDCVAGKTLLSNHVEMMSETDVVIINGEGSMYGNRQYAKANLLLAYVAKVKLNKPTAIVNHRIDLSDPDLHNLVSHIYPLMDDVVFREKSCLEESKNICNGKFAADSCYYYRPLPRDSFNKRYTLKQTIECANYLSSNGVPKLDPSKPYITVGGSSYVQIEFDLICKNYEVLLKKLKKLPIQIVLTASGIPDHKMFKVLSKKLSLPFIGINTSAELGMDIINQSELYIGGRWHPSNFALAGGAPIIPLSSKTPKMSALNEMLPYESEVYSLTELDKYADSIVQKAEFILDAGVTLKKEVSEWSKQMAATVQGNVDILTQKVI